MRIKRGGFWLRYGLCLVMCLIWVSPISAMSTFSVSENIAEREAVRKGEWQWIRSQVDFDWIERRVSANLDYIRIERDMAWTRLAIREIRRIQRYHLESRPTLLDLAPPAPVPVLSTIGLDPSKKESPAFTWPTLPSLKATVRASGYKYFDFSYAKGEKDTGFTRSESLKLNLAAYSRDVTVNVSIDQSSLNTGDKNKTQIEFLHPNAHVILGEFKTNFAALDILKYNAQLEGIQSDFNWNDHSGGFIYSVAKGARKKEIVYGNNSQGPFTFKFRPVVPQSEQIVLNKVAQTRDIDYQIDYASGTVRFLKKIVVPEDQLVMTYESENEAYKDKIMGAKYRLSTGKDTGVGVVLIQKSYQSDTESGSAFLRRNVGAIVADHVWASTNIHTEFAISDLKGDGASVHDQGNAAAIRLNRSDTSSQWDAYFLSIGSGFQSIDSAGFNPGDIKLGGKYLTQWHGWSVGSGFDSIRQTVNGIGSVEQSSRLNVGTKIGNTSYTLGVQEQFHSEDTGGSPDYRRQLAYGGFEFPVWLGKWVAQTGVERRQDYAASANSFDAITAATGYSVKVGDQLTAVLESGIKSYSYPSTANQLEQSLKFNSVYRPSDSDSLEGQFEYKGKTNAYPITAVSLLADNRLDRTLSVSSKLRLESLKEVFNAQELDMEQWDNTIRVNYDPFSFSKFKTSYKLNEKKPKNGAPAQFSNQEWSIDATLIPQRATQLSVQQRFKFHYRSQLQYYPNALFREFQEDQRTTVLRLAHQLESATRIIAQYETETKDKDTLVSTSNGDTKTESLLSDKYKVELSNQIWGIGWGGGYEAVRELTLAPTENSKTKDIYTGFAQWRWLEVVTTKLTMNFINNYDGEFFESTKPQVDIDINNQGISVSLRYSYLDERRGATRPITEVWDANVKIEFHKNLLLTGTFRKEIRTHPSVSNLEVSGRVAVVF